MRTIIAGSRNITDPHVVADAMSAAIEAWGPECVPTVVLSGCCRGADKLGEEWALANGIPVEHFPADWKKYGRSAGPMRNATMVANADGLVAIWDGKSKGTEGAIWLARQKGLRVWVQRIGCEDRL